MPRKKTGWIVCEGTYDGGHTKKVVPADRTKADYILVGGPNKEALAEKIAKELSDG